jgi:hypothetical protein
VIYCNEVYGDDYKSFLRDFIPYLESKPEDEWIDIIFANKDTSKRCVIYHFLGFVGQDHPGAKCSNNLDWYEANVCFIQQAGCNINDTKSENYPQDTPKQRSIAYLKNLLEGREFTPMEMLDKFVDGIKEPAND